MAHVGEVVRAALAEHKSGNLESAERLYREVLSREPDHFDAWQLLGTLAHQMGRADVAREALERALRTGKPSAMVYYNLGNVLRDQGRFEEAADSYGRAIELRPKFFVARLNLGSTLDRLGRRDEAIAAHLAALQLEPRNPDGLINLGATLLARGQADEAIGCFRRAIASCPHHAKAHVSLGTALGEMGHHRQAVEALQEAVRLDPDALCSLVSLGHALARCDRLDEAADHYQHALAAHPDSYELHTNLGTVYQDMDQPQRALPHYDRARRLCPGRAEALANLAPAEADLGHFEQAEEHYLEALELAGDDAEIRCNRALLLIQTGRFAEGWDQYESRLEKRSRRARRRFTIPRWDGEALSGKTIFVHAEQGIGDEIMFASCVDDLIARGGRCVLTANPRLAELFTRSFAEVEVLSVERGKEDFRRLSAGADFHVPSGSLPRYFRRCEEDFPHCESFLTADPARVASWRRRFADLGPGLAVGISWRAGKTPRDRRKRSVPLSLWWSVAEVPGIHLVNLQYGDCADEIAAARREGVDLYDWPDADAHRDVDGLAAQIAALDLVISVGNAAVHLAGALGTPTWALLPVWWGWRWGIGRDRALWYRSVRLLRQQTQHDWEGLLGSVGRRLSEWQAPERQPRAGGQEGRGGDVRLQGL